MPYIAMQRMTPSVHILTSSAVCGMQIGFPVVPEEQWKRLISDIGAAVSPSGYSSRRSVFFMNGNFPRSASVTRSRGLTPFSSQRRRKSATCSYSYGISS